LDVTEESDIELVYLYVARELKITLVQEKEDVKLLLIRKKLLNNN
jgi:hypothetical protein